MEREIIFRAKAVNTEMWVYGDLVRNQKVTKEGFEPRTMVGGYEVYKDTIGQFTGLLDCNAKRIYEGDIIEVTSLSDTSLGKRTNAIVIFRNSAFQLKHKAKEALLLTHWAEDVVKVISNIYDNKELLKGE